METIAALLFATSILGSSASLPHARTIQLAPLAQLEACADESLSKHTGKEQGGEAAPGPESGATTPAPEPADAGVEGREPVVAQPAPPPPPEEASEPVLEAPRPTVTSNAAESSDGSRAFEALAEQGRRRARLRGAHRAMGIATWAAMTATLTLGALQFADRYGAADLDQTRCARGNPILGDANCDAPYFHIFGIVTTASLYATTFGLSVAMSRADGGDERSSSAARRLRMHRTLRWVHLATLAAQVVGGLIIANLDAMGVDPTENYETFRGLNVYHMAAGAVSWVFLTWAGALMIGS
jgi:hypothetical protein